MKKHIRAIIFLITILMFTIAAHAESTLNKSESVVMELYDKITASYQYLETHGVNLQLNGENIVSDVPAFLSNNRTMVPVRIISEKMQAVVEWDQSNQQVKIKNDKDTIILTIGSSEAIINGIAVPLYDNVSVSLVKLSQDNTARTMVPLRFVTEHLGLSVNWNQDTYTAEISKKETTDTNNSIPAAEAPTGGIVVTSGAVTSPPAVVPYSHLKDLSITDDTSLTTFTLTGETAFNYIYAYTPSENNASDVLTIAFPNIVFSDDGNVLMIDNSIDKILDSTLVKNYTVSQYYKDGQYSAVLKIYPISKIAFSMQYNSESNKLSLNLAPVGTSGYIDPPAYVASVYNGKIITLDPGHGGVDPGACSGKIYEKTYNYSVALRLKELLQNQGFTVAMVRTSDVKVENYVRAYMANALKSDIYLSIHHNSSSNSSISGIQTLCDGAGNPNKLVFAQIIQKNLVNGLGMNDMQIINKSTYIVTRETRMTSALAELGFLSCASDRGLIITDEFNQKCAGILCNSIIEYLQTEI